MLNPFVVYHSYASVFSFESFFLIFFLNILLYNSTTLYAYRFTAARFASKNRNVFYGNASKDRLFICLSDAHSLKSTIAIPAQESYCVLLFFKFHRQPVAFSPHSIELLFLKLEKPTPKLQVI